MKKLTAVFVLAASPAFAATGPFFSLHNTDFIVTLAFLLFVGVLFYYKVPAMLGGMLDKRAAGIKADLEEARSLREEAQEMLATYERKSREVQDTADLIVATARRDAMAAADAAKAELKVSIARRLKAAEEQIASAEAAAVRDVKHQAVSVAVAAAGELLAAQLSADAKAKLIDASIGEVATRLN
ncbi:MAG: ATP F0F1 synthase subunit B [Alphaproteobacteria bacterium HGW-Alphaproteobacteria-4]|jgi:F-type H+-transporting ATPase subunit b|nr:MAG: ATP F0F1 synthase subunit B [Alphaproteobacteria bacterium HGW-Alphaproteobacteria-4]